MSESSFDIDAFCASGGDGTDVTAAICTYETNFQGLVYGVNSFFLIISGALVFCMQIGFAMLCAGSVRQKNVKNIMLKNLLDACGGAIGFFTVGFALAFGGDQDGITFVGNRNFALRDYDNLAFFFFQFAFAATAATIVAGSVAERCKMSAYLYYSVILTGFVYPVVVHSVWDDNGMLSAFGAQEDLFRGVGAIDFAGSGVVHLVGGTTSLVAIIVLGPRIGRFYDKDGNPLEEPKAFPPHSVALQILGTFILWFGWYGFNPGSILAIDTIDKAQVASLAAVTTTLAAASGAISAMFFDCIIVAYQTAEVSYDLTMAMNGALSGLVAITAGCSVIAPWASIVVGAVGGVVYMSFSKLLIKLKIDDAVDAVPVHFANGVWGLLATGLFAKGSHMTLAGYNAEHEGWFYSWGKGSADANLLLAQITEVGWIIGWVTATMLPYFVVLNKFGLFRVDALEEEVGLDITHHRGAAYDLTAAKKEDVDELMERREASHHGGQIHVPDYHGSKVHEPEEVIQFAVVADGRLDSEEDEEA